MLTKWLGARPKTALLLAFLSLSGSALSQEVSLALLRPESMKPAPFATTPYTITLPEKRPAHHFWDRENSVLFATGAGLSTADFFVTRANLRSGGQELNPVSSLFTGSTTALALNFAGESAGVVGLSY